jgi:phosphopantothenoylcysteine decarboxylase/phosphopantothenate--cysteine ligase
MTKAAREFVTPLTFEVLSGRRVLLDMFATSLDESAGPGLEQQLQSRAELSPLSAVNLSAPEPQQVPGSVQHIDAVADSDLILVAPATGNMIGKVASGVADDLLSSIIMAAGGKVAFAPAMNVRMWDNAIVQANVKRLRSLGYGFVEPETGELACGETGKGRLASVERIVSAVEAILLGRRPGEKTPFSGVRILVTAGRTEEPIDDVRYISNRSSGRMGYAIASAARDLGGEVTLVSGPASVEPPGGVKLVRVRTAGEMRRAVMAASPASDVVFMVAAVSDFTPSRTRKGKIPRDTGEIELGLKRTDDILGAVGGRKGKKLLVGFAVETEDEVRRAKEKLRKKNLDLIVVNNPLVPGAGFEVDTNVVTMIDSRGKIERLPLMSKRDAAGEILKKTLSLRSAPSGRRASPARGVRR